MSRNRHGTRPARPIRSAVDSINDSIEPYLKYMIKKVPKEIAEIDEGDSYLGRFRYVYPRPYTLEEYERIYDWMVGWDLLAPESPFRRHRRSKPHQRLRFTVPRY